MNRCSISSSLFALSLLAGGALLGQGDAGRFDADRGRALAREALAAADTNGDGGVTRNEFTGPARLFDRADTNADGTLTLPEFESETIPPDDVVAIAFGSIVEDTTLLSRLQAGGLVILFRHGETHRDDTDQINLRGLASASPAERQAAFFDCSRQRLLTNEGRDKLRSIAASIQSIGFHVASVEVSPMCRTRETAWLVFGQVTPNDALVVARELQARRALAGRIPSEGSNAALITHSQLVTSIVWSPSNPANPGEGIIPEGHAYILEPLGDSRYNFLAQLGPEDWARLAEMSR